MNPIAKTGAIDTKAEYLITVTWPDGNPSERRYVDAGPGRQPVVVLPRRKPASCTSTATIPAPQRDVITVNGRTVENPLNQEIVSIRGVVPGEFTVNVKMYAYDAGDLARAPGGDPRRSR